MDQLVLLGTGTPNAEPDRSGPAAAVVVDQVPYLVDCGPNVVRQAAAAHRQGVEGLAAAQLERVFLTHLHSDHTIGLPDLILTPWVLEREAPLQVFGPPGTRAMIDHLLAAYQADIDERIGGLEPANTTGHRVFVHEIKAGPIYADQRVQIEAFAAHHGRWPAFSYRFTTPGRTIVLSGDTAPHPGMEAAYSNCDLLLHEVYSAAGRETRPPEWQRYHAVVHTSGLELGEIATRVRPGLLILTHQLTWGKSEKSVLAEIATRYDGSVAWGRDLEIY